MAGVVDGGVRLLDVCQVRLAPLDLRARVLFPRMVSYVRLRCNMICLDLTYDRTDALRLLTWEVGGL